MATQKDNQIVFSHKRKFVSWDVPASHDRYDNMTMADMKQLYADLAGGYNPKLDSIKHHGYVKEAGTLYAFNLPKFLVKQYGSWQEYFAPNKTLLRKAIHGRIDQIVAM